MAKWYLKTDTTTSILNYYYLGCAGAKLQSELINLPLRS